MFNDEAYLVKLILLGDAGVGKTSLRRSLAGENFNSSYKKTIGVDITHLSLTNNTDGDFIFTISDIAGDSPFNFIRKTYFAGASAGCFIFDLTKAVDEEKFNQWVEDLSTAKGLLGNFTLMVIGNKNDLKDRIIQNEETLSSYIKQLEELESVKNIKYFEASAKTGNGVMGVLNWAIPILREYINTMNKLKVKMQNPDNYPCASFIMSTLGPTPQYYTQDKFLEAYPEFGKDNIDGNLLKMGISYISALGQGHRYSEGVFELPPGDFVRHKSIIVSKRIHGEEIENNFFVFTILIEEEFSKHFTLTQNKKDKIFDIFESFVELEMISEANVFVARELIINLLFQL